jgi:hypothetical protein
MIEYRFAGGRKQNPHNVRRKSFRAIRRA